MSFEGAGKYTNIRGIKNALKTRKNRKDCKL